MFGLLGLGQIYRDYRDSKGWIFLIVGLLLFGLLTLMMYTMATNGFVVAVLMSVITIVIGLVYLLTAAVAFVDARMSWTHIRMF